MLISQIFFIYALLLRFFAIHEKKRVRRSLWGIYDDLACGFQIGAIASIPFVGKLIALLILGYLFVDFCYYKATKGRLRPWLLKKATHVGTYFGSMSVALRMTALLGGTAVMALSIAALLLPNPFSLMHCLIAVGLTGLALLIEDFEFPNLLILLERDLFSFRMEKRVGGLNFTPFAEDYQVVDSRYPAYRKSLGFHGKLHSIGGYAEGEKPNVVIVGLESLRAKDVCREVTPVLCNLIDEGIYFDRFYSNGTLTNKMVISTLFGVYPKFDSEGLNPKWNLRGMPEIFKEQGYELGAFKGGDLSFDYEGKFYESHGFDCIVGKEKLMQRYPDEKTYTWGIDDRAVFEEAGKWLEGGPKFAFIKSISAHYPFQNYQGTRLERYRKALRYTDMLLEAFVNKVRDNSIVILLGDHGISMQERGQSSSLFEGLYEENIHVPCLILAPKMRFRSSEVASQVDLLPTLLDMLSIHTNHHAMGRSLLRKMENSYAFALNPFDNPSIAWIQGDHKYIHHMGKGRGELYNLKNDPEEQNNISQRIPTMVGNYRKAALSHFNFSEAQFQRRNHCPPQAPEVKFSPTIDHPLSEILKRSEQMVELSLRGCDHFESGHLRAVLENIPTIKMLDVGRSWLMNDEHLKSLGKHLEGIDLSHCPLTTKEGISSFLQEHSQLRFITLNGLMHLDDDVLASIRATPERLSLLGCTLISDRGLKSLAKQLDSIVSLSIEAPHVTDVGLYSIARSAKSLRTLHLSGCPKITQEGLNYLLKGPVETIYLYRHPRGHELAKLSDRIHDYDHRQWLYVKNMMNR
ncbi:MAG: sulfatase-like hydrolase/transferase [Simkaniaceae bacterium]|nr:sulfatase-like hydrolase/transferase [Simkaniaceae bacterium]